MEGSVHFSVENKCPACPSAVTEHDCPVAGYQAWVLSGRNHIHTDNLLACTEREIGGMLLVLSEKALFRQLSGTLLELRVEETGLHPFLSVLAPRVNALPMAAVFSWCQFPLFSPSL